MKDPYVTVLVVPGVRSSNVWLDRDITDQRPSGAGGSNDHLMNVEVLEFAGRISADTNRDACLCDVCCGGYPCGDRL